MEALAGKENDAAAAEESIHMQKANKIICESGRSSNRFLHSFAKESLPATHIRLLLHLARRDGEGWTGDTHSGAGVDDRDGVAGAQSRRLMDFQVLGVVMVVVVGGGLEAGGGMVGIIGCRGQGEGCGDLLGGLDLVLEGGGIGGAAGEGGAIGGGRVD